MIHLCKPIRLFFSLRQIWNEYSYRHSFEMIIFLSEKPAEARLQTDLGFGCREQTGTCNRYTWNSSDSSAPKMRLRLFLAAVVKNKGSVLLLCLRCDFMSRRKKHGVGGWGCGGGFQISACEKQTALLCRSWPYLSLAGAQNNQKYNLCIAGRGIKKRRRSKQPGQALLHSQIWWQCPRCPVAYPQFYKQRV